jgi:hypothetical protein
VTGVQRVLFRSFKKFAYVLDLEITTGY